MIKNIEYTVDESTGCWNCTSHKVNINNRGFVGYFICNRGGYRSLHRYMYAQKYGDISSDDIIRHICDNPMCINPEHLIKGTHNDNVQDRVNRNRSAIGEKNGRAKLTEAQVIEIYNSDYTNSELANIYHVDNKVIYDIKHKNKWKYLLNDLH